MNNVTFILDTRRPLQDGTFPVKLSVGNGTRLYLSTGVSVKAVSISPDRKDVLFK